MAGIFHIFSETENNNSLSLNKGKENVKLKSNGSSGFTSAKNFTQPLNKPRGLSIRSKSDLNVCISQNSGASKLNPKKTMSEDSKQCFSVRQSISPMKVKASKSNSLTNLSEQKLSPKVTSPIMQNVIDEFVFKKPIIPKKLISYPDPEYLYHDYDSSKLIAEEVESIFNADRLWLRSATKMDDSVTSIEDEGFISDPESDSFLMQPEILSPFPSLGDVTLPEISDSDD